MSSAICFNFDQSKFLSSANVLIYNPPIERLPTTCGLPMNWFLEHLWFMTSRIRCFCPLYVVRIEIFSAGYPRSLMYINTATTYSASPRF